MNSQDISILNEIYLNIYETDRTSGSNKPTFKPKSRERDIGPHNDWKDKPLEWGERPESGKKLKRRLNAVVSTRRREDKEVGIREDVYDIILSHLLDEGYADTEESAESIMVNMSEDWREEILESASKQSDKQIEKGIKTTYKASNVLDNLHQGRSKGISKLDPSKRQEKVKGMRSRLKTRRDDLFKERNKRNDEKNEKLKRLLGL